MKKLLIIVLVAVSLLSMGASAESPSAGKIAVAFRESPENADIAGILSVLNASQVTATIHTDTPDAKYFEIWMVERNAIDTKRSKIGYCKIGPDSTKVTFTAVAKDSLNAIISFVGISAGMPRVEPKIPTANHLLIGCDFGWTFNETDTIPLVAYSTGIPHKYDVGNGRILEGYYVCGIRNSKIKPYDWKDEYHLSDYLYFEAIPVKEMNYDFQ